MVTEEFYQYISSIDNLRFLSAKFSTIAQLCRDDPGNCYVYSDFVQLGADLLGIVFEGLGLKMSAPVYSCFREVRGSSSGMSVSIRGGESHYQFEAQGMMGKRFHIVTHY